jgi:hypothetical protein
MKLHWWSNRSVARSDDPELDSAAGRGYAEVEKP